MIEQTFYFALAANWLVQSPVWQNLIAEKWEKNPEYDNVYSKQLDQYRSPDMNSFSAWMPGVDKVEIQRLISLSDAYEKNNRTQVQTNWFARKPFTCLYCITFWLVVLFAAVYTVWYHYIPTTWGVMVTAPVVAVAFQRWFNSLPVKF